MTIWKRYLLKSFLRFFFFFIAAFYFLYVAIDYSFHMQDFMQGKEISIGKLFLYYGFQFVKRADILFPLALMISTLRLLFTLNTRFELVAFQSAGLRWKKLAQPLLSVAFCCTLICLCINEYVLPSSLTYIDRFYDAHLRHSFRGKRMQPLRILHLEDHSKLVYQFYDLSKEAFFDVIWIKSPDEVWKIKHLSANPTNPQAGFVDHLQRMENGQLEKVASYPEITLHDLKWSDTMPRRGFIPFENHSLTELFAMHKQEERFSSYERQELLTQFLFKTAMPFLCPLAIIGVAPFCVRLKRIQKQFMTYAIALFSLVAFIALMDASVILGENSALSPLKAVLIPFLFLTGFFNFQYWKAR